MKTEEIIGTHHKQYRLYTSLTELVWLQLTILLEIWYIHNIVNLFYQQKKIFKKVTDRLF